MANLKKSEHIAGIDGLRAIAVLAIILFHLDPNWLPGGFVGVDVFFVISGFVVAYSVGATNHTSLGRYFLWFYRRRIVRIYPVLLVFVLLTVTASALFIPLADTSKFIELTGAAAVAGVSNVLLWLKSGDYFATSAEYNVFTHTWSLGVEEQYYFLFPFFSYFALVEPSERNRKIAIWLVAITAIASLALCAFLSVKRPEAAFYLLPTRFWELALGFLIYVLCFKAGRVPRDLDVWAQSPLAALGGIALLATSLVFASSTDFPFPWAIPPVLGTALLILAAVKTPESVVARALAWPLLRWIGAISFSLYLWHWSVIVLMKWTVGIDTLALKAIAAAAMFGLSAASYYLIENPARTSTWLRHRTTPVFYAGALASIAVVVAMSVGTYVFKPVLTLSSTGQVAVWDPQSPYEGGGCGRSRQVQEFGTGLMLTYSPTACPAQGTTIFVMGDSHAGAYNRLFERLAAEDGYRVILYTMGGCKLIGGLDPQPVPGCAEFRDAALSAISTSATANDIAFFPGHYTRRFRDTWHNDFLATSGQNPIDQSAVTSAAADAIESLAPLAAAGTAIMLEAPKPILQTALFRCVDWYTSASSYCSTKPEVARDTLLERAATVRVAQSSIAQATNAVVWNPFDTLCPGAAAQCPAFANGEPLYYDTDHLTAYGNDVLYPSFHLLLTSPKGTPVAHFSQQSVAASSR